MPQMERLEQQPDIICKNECHHLTLQSEHVYRPISDSDEVASRTVLIKLVQCSVHGKTSERSGMTVDSGTLHQTGLFAMLRESLVDVCACSEGPSHSARADSPANNEKGSSRNLRYQQEAKFLVDTIYELPEGTSETFDQAQSKYRRRKID